MTHPSLDVRRLTSRARVQNVVALLLVATLAIGAAGCGSNDSTTAPTDLDVSGEYFLETIQAKSIPVKIYDGPIGSPRNGDYYRSFVVTVQRGLIDLDYEGNYHLIMDYRRVADGETRDGSIDAWGTFELQGNRIFLTREDGVDGGSGTVRSNEVMIEMTIVDEGKIMPYVFRH